MPRPRLLLLDRDPELREIVSRLLGEVGFQVLAASSPDEADAHLDASDIQAAVLELPRANEESWRTLCALQRKASPSPVGISAEAPPDPERAVAAGFSFVLRKPYGVDALFRHVATAVQWRPVAARERSLVAAYFAALSAKDWEALGALCTDDVRYCLPGTNPFFSRVISGRENLLDYCERVFRDHPESHFELEELVALPETLVARCHNTWTEDGVAHEHSSSVLLTVRDDQISAIGVRMALDAIDCGRDPNAYAMPAEGGIRRKEPGGQP